jgi:hypothetical protein
MRKNSYVLVRADRYRFCGRNDKFNDNAKDTIELKYYFGINEMEAKLDHLPKKVIFVDICKKCFSEYYHRAIKFAFHLIDKGYKVEFYDAYEGRKVYFGKKLRRRVEKYRINI